MGLLWLTVRTIDGCFDRISDRPWRLPVLAIVVIILAGTMGAGSLLWAIEAWVEGMGEVMYVQELQCRNNPRAPGVHASACDRFDAGRYHVRGIALGMADASAPPRCEGNWRVLRENSVRRP